MLNEICDRVQANYLRVKSIYIAQIPIPDTLRVQATVVGQLVRNLLSARGEGPQVAEWERELNALVYQAYGLSGEGIAIIEERLAAGKAPASPPNPEDDQ